MNWQEQKRLNEAARAEQKRQDALAAAQIEQMRTRAQVEATQEMAAQQAEQARQRVADREQRKNEARDRRKATWKTLREWATAHMVDLLIYPLAVVSAVMAVPAMADFGHDVYGTAAGYALPVITELGMWAFAFAVELTRQRTEQDGTERSVWALQLGVWSFAAVAAGLNFLHGSTSGPVVFGVVMAVASVAGVLAHQLVTAAPRRGRADRAAARIERQAAGKVTRVRRAAVRSAVAEIDPDGAARLLFAPGRYRLTRSRFAPWRRRRLDSITLPDLPVAPALHAESDPEWDSFERELAVLLDTVDPYPPAPSTGSTSGSVGTLDRESDQQESTPIDRDGDRAEKRSRSRRKSGRKARQLSARSIEELRTELRSLIEADPGSINPESAESIRRALRCSPARARELRDTYRPNH